MFEENEQDEIFNALNYPNWKETVWTEEEVEDVLLYPTIAKMQRVLAVKDINTIERIRGKMVFLNNTNLRKPIQNVIDVVNGRLFEIQRGRMRTELDLKLKIPEDTVNKMSKENEELKKEKSEMADQMRRMREQLNSITQQLKAQQEASLAPKKPGRPKKTTATD